jgi:hypothetical protein
METPLYFICTIGFSMALFVLFFNKGYKNANRYLAGYLFFSSLYMMQSFVVIYSKNINLIVLFTLTQPFFYLIGPFAFLHIRSIIVQSTKISKFDLLHFILFAISFVGLFPYLFSSWDNKLLAAANISQDNWDTSFFNLNSILKARTDQICNLLQIFFYTLALWYLMIFKSKKLNLIGLSKKQFDVVKRYLIVFCILFTFILFDFIFAIWCMIRYSNKTEFIYRTDVIILVATCIYLTINFSILFFPRLMTGVEPER